RGEVKQVVDLTAETRGVLLGDPEPGLGEIANDSGHAVGVRPPAVLQLLQATLGPLAHEHVDGPLPLEQELHQVAADEAGRSGDEVAHLVSSTVTVLRNLALPRRQ